jgi:hypothetical protein
MTRLQSSEMAKTLAAPVATPLRDQEKVKELLRELEALPEGHILSDEELSSFIRRMPKMPEGWTSAVYFDDERGPGCGD